MQLPDMKNPKVRTAVLGGAAVTLIGLLAADTLLQKEAQTPIENASKTANTSAKEAPLLGAPPVGKTELLKRYEPVLTTGPFTTRSFRPRPKASPRPPRSRDPEPRKAPPKPTGPQPIQVRWTGVIGEGETASAVLEERSTGRGLFAAKGLKVGEVAFLSVAPETLVVETSGKKKSLALGDAFELPHTAKDQMSKLGPPAPKGGGSSTYKPGVKLDAGKRQSILERLRARRRASLNKKKADGKKTDAKKTDAKKTDTKKEGK